ncbi:MAG: hypothetical protein ABI960_01635 [Candidatus Eisenbacteria bacterium]
MRPRLVPSSRLSARMIPLGIALALALFLVHRAGAQAPQAPSGPDTAASAADSAGPDSSAQPPIPRRQVLPPVLPPDSLAPAPPPAPVPSVAAPVDTLGLRLRAIPPFVPGFEPPRLDRTSWITWTPRVSRLAIPRFLVGELPFEPAEPWQLRYQLDARTVQLTVDPEKGTVKTALTAADVPLSEAREIPFEDYARELTTLNLRRTWISESAARIDRKPTQIGLQGKRGPFEFRLPVDLPKGLEGVFGRGGPTLNVSGSERISISGTSQWDNRISGSGIKRSLFPQLDMRQDLNIALNGSLGDKVHVDVAQNSANTLPLANRIGIRYGGYEDEILKSLDLGNTNLALPGTQYVSYSGRNEGLFGVKAAARVGGTDLALIASKQEGRSERKSFQGTAQEVVRQIDDLNYIKGKYFFLQRPAEQLATNSRIEIGTLKVFVDDRNGSNDQGVRGGYAEIDPGALASDSTRLKGSFDGLEELKDYEITFDYYGERFPVIVLKSALSNSQVLGVSYQEVLADGSRRFVGRVPDCPTDVTLPCDSIHVKILQAPQDRLPARRDNPNLYETDPAVAPFIVTRDYEIKSFYDLQTSSIDPKSLQLQVRRYDANLDESNDAYKEGTALFSYLRIMGVDLFKDNGSGSPSEGTDALVDQFTNADFLDLDRGILFFPDLRPFDPRLPGRADAAAHPEDEYFFRPRIANTNQTIPGLRGRVFWPAGQASPPNVENSPITPTALETNPNVYDKRSLTPSSDRKYYIYAKFSGQDFSGQIYLGQTNLLEGSEVVAIEGVPLERNKDYTIDYQAGTLTLLTARARENRSRLTIDYSFAPLFAQAGRTLIGSTIGYRGFDRSFGGAFIYEAKGQQEARPRLGEEPSRTLIGDVYTQLSLKPRFLTSLVDKLPFYSTTEESHIDINGELGYSRPNPNTKNTVYLDDFEGNRDSYSAPMSRGFWKWASPPLVRLGAGAVTDTVQNDYAELIWYNPYNTVKAGDLNPRLTRNEGNQNLITALDFYVPKAPVDRRWQANGMWNGVTTTVDPDGADFSRLQYLEVWLNDWRDPDVRQNAKLKLHIDLGIVSEDQQRAPNAPPNGIFDTEDKNKDGKYDPPGPDPAQWEDGGADGLPDQFETDLYDLSTATDADKHGDNYFKARDEQGREVQFSDNSNTIQRLNPFVYIGPTLTEKSKSTVEGGSRVFTEDLNNNQLLDTSNDYVSYVLPLGDQNALSRFLIFSAESTLTTEGTPVAPNNGWKRYRIPLDENDPAFRQVIGSGGLSNVKHMRVWLEGIDTFKGNATPAKTSAAAPGRQPLIEIAAIDVVGNRWRIASADSALQATNGSIVARNVNNQEDRNIYDPPFNVDTQNRAGSSQTQREQSLALEVTRLPVGSTATIFKTETLPEDYTRYSRLAFYTAQFGFMNEDSARFFVRIGYDDRNYYEYSRPIRDAASAPYRPTPWQSYTVDLTAFTDVKFHRPNGAVTDTAYNGDERFVVVGSPTFTRVQQFSLGVYSDRARPDSGVIVNPSLNAMSGQVWIDDLRALDVDRSPGVANRLTVFTKVADLLTLTTNLDNTDENFQRLGQLRGSDVNSGRFSMSGTFAPHRFIAASGVQLPLSFNYARQTSTPRLFTGTDIVLGAADARAERTTGVDRGFGVAFSKSGDRNPILKNTIGRINLNFSFADRVGHSPTSIDSSRTIAGGGNYSLSPSEWFKIPLPFLRTRSGPQKLAILPTTASIAFSQQTSRSFLYKRGLGDPIGVYSLQSDVYRKTSLYQLSASWRPLPFGSYSVNATRNAYIPGIIPARILGVNFGRMTNFGQRIDGRFGIKLTKYFNPNFDFSSSYTEQRTPDLSPDLQLGQFQNSTNGGVSLEVPFARLFAGRPAAPAPPQPAVTDSSRRDSTAVIPPAGRGFSLPVGKLLARLGNINLRGTFSRTTGFARYSGVPSVPYRLGLVRDPDTQWNGEEVLSIYRGPQATENAQRTWSGDASTQIALIGRSSVRVRSTFTNTNRVFNTQVSNQQNLTFPDLDFDWGAVQQIMRLGKAFPQIGARSRFSRVDSRDGADLANPTSKTRSQNLTPLLSLQGTSRGQAVVQLSIDRTSSSREDFSSRRATRKEGTSTFRTSVSRTYLPGQKVPIFGGKGLKSSLTLQADASYNKRTGETNAFGAASSKTNNDRLDFNSSSTYAFSSYVNGTIGIGFSQSRDLQLRNVDGKPLVQRSIRLEAAATFRF